MKNLERFFESIIFALCLVLSIFISCPAAQAKSFSIHLFYDPNFKTLGFDKEFKDSVTISNRDISISEFAFQQMGGIYILKLYDLGGVNFIETEFNKTDGAFNINLPYFSLAKELKIFEKSTGMEILQADLSKFMTCNGNGICEYEKGENYYTCLGDCDREKTVYSAQTLKLLEENEGVIKDQKTGDLLLDSPEITADYRKKSSRQSAIKLIILLIVSAALLVTAAIFVLRAFRKRKGALRPSD